MLAGSTGRGWIARGTVWLAALGASATGVVVAADVAAELKAASAAYAAAYNKADYAALADQWTERATLVEGRLELEGREAIVNSLRAWRERQLRGLRKRSEDRTVPELKAELKRHGLSREGSKTALVERLVK